MKFLFDAMFALDTEVTVGPSTTVGGRITIEGANQDENTWTWAVDATSVNSLLSYPIRTGNPGTPNTMGAVLNYHDGTAAGGNAIGKGAVDMMTTRGAATHVASGGQSGLFAGQSNSAAAGNATIVGGTTNAVTGLGSFIAGSQQAVDRGRTWSRAYSSGAPNGVGSAQAGRQALMATRDTQGVGAMRLTSAGALPASAFNSMNIVSNSAFNIMIQLVAIDRTTPANTYAWTLPIGLLTQGANAATTALALGTPVVLSTGTGSTASVSATADTTNGGLNLSFTPPVDADVWDVFADVNSAEIR
jgi:hypothetical protein